ncbi:SEC-C metal-binding domain-containing protein [Inquilinus limosus]
MVEKLGRRDLCPCGSGRSFQALLPEGQALRRGDAEALCPRLTPAA